jgi:membrane protease YdiL (CAAX protease family)
VTGVPGAGSAVRRHLAELHPRRFFLETWQRMDAEAEAERDARRARGTGYDWRPLAVLCSGAVFLTAMRYFGSSRRFAQLLGAVDDPFGEDTSLWATLTFSPFGELYEYCWWAGWRVLGYFVFPCIVTWLLGERVRDQGLSVQGFRKHAWIYAVLFAAVLPLVVGVSFTEDFTRYYPFYGRAGRSWFDLLAWELLYAAQFFALEFFFRGWWLQSCKAMMGSHAIFAMVVPYCMIHYGKPWPEAFAAVVAGLVLGTLAMKTRSIWSGVLIHISVATSMDVLALLQKGGFPERAWPVLP